MGEQLAWGTTYVAVRPDHFRVDYPINPFMDPAVQPDPAARPRAVGHPGRHHRASSAAPSTSSTQRARRPRHGLRDEPRPRRSGAQRRHARHVVLSHMRYAERRMETAVRRSRGSPSAAAPRRTSAATASAPTSRPATRSPSATRWSSATARAPRSSALKHLATDLGVRVRGLRITHPGMYHLDLAFCPLDEPPRDRLPGRLRRRLGRGAARAGARAAGADRGGGADHLRRQLDRGRRHRA